MFRLPVKLPVNPLYASCDIDRTVPGTTQVVRFRVEFSPQGPKVIANVKEGGSDFNPISIANLPPFTPSSKQAEVLEFLRQRAIASFQSKVHFLPKDPLDLYQQWKTGNGSPSVLSNDAPSIQQCIETIAPAVTALESALLPAASGKLSFLDIGTGKKKLAREIGIGDAYRQLGKGYAKLSHYQEAFLAYQLALKSAIAGKDSDLEGCIYSDLGKMYVSVGEYKKAIELFQKDLEIGLKLADLAGIASAYSNIGIAYVELGEGLKANECYEKSLEIYKQTGSLKDQCFVYNNLGVSHLTLRNVKKASEYHQKQLEIARQIGFEAGEEAALRGIGHVNLISKGDMTVMFEFHKNLTDAQKTGNFEAQQTAYINLGDIDFHLEEYHSALTCYENALEIAKKRNDLTVQQITYCRIGDTYKIMRKYKLAIQAYRQSMDAATSLQNSNTEGDLPKGIAYFETLFYPFRLLEELLVTNIEATPPSNPVHAALLLADSSRSRALVGVLAKAAGGIRSSLSIKQMQSIAARYHTTFLIYSCSPFEDIKAWVWVIPPRGEIVHHFLNLTPMKKEMATQDKRTDHLQTIRGNRDQAFSQVANWITRGPTAITEAQLAERSKVMQLWYECLIEPIKDKLPQNEGARLTIVPDAVIGDLPFSLFKGKTGETLLERYTLSTVPSIQTLAYLDAIDQKKATTRNLDQACIVANPEGSILGGAEKEGIAVAKFFNNAKLLMDDKATLTNVTEALPKAGFIHLACHGLTVDQEGNPIKQNKNSVFQGSFALAGSNLYAEDLMRTPLNAKLAVLSACHSGKGSLLKEGVVGPMHALLAAGVSTVVGTRWAIDDQATQLIIEKFYHFYFNETPESQKAQAEKRPFGAAEALREALLFVKREVHKGNLTSPDPYDPDFTAAWGAFFLVGTPDK